MSVLVRRVAIGILAVMVCLFLLPLDALFEAGLQFVAAGVVPGVGVVITPAQTILLLSEVALLVVLLIFRREFARAVTKEPMFEYTRQVSSNIATPKPVVVIRVPSKPGRLTLLGHALIAAIPTPVRRYTATLRLRALLWFYKTLYHTVIFRTRLKVRLNNLSIQIGKLLIRAGKAMCRFALFVCKRAAPYLWKIDRYIEAQVKQSQAYAFLLKKAREVRPLIAAWRQNAARAWSTFTAKD